MLPESLLPPWGQALQIERPTPAAFASPSWLGDPIPAHQDLHERCPVCDVVDTFVQILAQPVQLAQHRNGLYATVLGAYLIHLEASGRLLTWRWSPRGPVPLDEHELALQCMVSEADWLERNANLLGTALFELSRRMPTKPPASMPVPPTTRAYGQWLISEIAQALLTPKAIAQTQSSLRQTLGLHDALLARAVQLPPRVVGRRGASVGDYNLMITSAAKIDQIKKDSPPVADLFPLFCDAPDFDHTLEPAAALRQFLREHGVDQATWRALCAMGSTPLEPLLSLYDAPRDKAMLDLLNCLSTLKLRLSSKLWALEHLFSTFGAAGSRPMRYHKSIEADPVLVHILACSPQCNYPCPQQIDELDLVLRWAMDEHIAKLDKRQRQAGWQWLVKQATHWQTRERLRLQTGKLRWSASITAVSIDQLSFEALLSELALWDEALALHHCADVYGYRCRDGAYLIYSVRIPAALAGSCEDKRVASLALSRLGPQWSIDQLVGPANSGVNDSVRKASLTLVNLMNRQPCTETAHIR